jgi:hypothetical protein
LCLPAFRFGDEVDAAQARLLDGHYRIAQAKLPAVPWQQTAD